MLARQRERLVAAATRAARRGSRARCARPRRRRGCARCRAARRRGPAPTRRGSVHVAAMPGWMPSRVKLRPSLASRAARRRSQARATQQPAPIAGPLIGGERGLRQRAHAQEQPVEAAHEGRVRAAGLAARVGVPRRASCARAGRGRRPRRRRGPRPSARRRARAASAASASTAPAKRLPHGLGHRVEALGVVERGDGDRADRARSGRGGSTGGTRRAARSTRQPSARSGALAEAAPRSRAERRRKAGHCSRGPSSDRLAPSPRGGGAGRSARRARPRTGDESSRPALVARTLALRGVAASGEAGWGARLADAAVGAGSGVRPDRRARCRAASSRARAGGALSRSRSLSRSPAHALVLEARGDHGDAISPSPIVSSITAPKMMFASSCACSWTSARGLLDLAQRRGPGRR